MTKNLDQLRQVAERATPGPWAVYDRGIGYEVHDANGCELNGGMRETFTEADATHIATFDPPTVLALIDRVEAAEESRRLADEVLRAVLEAMGSGPETDPIIKARQLVARAEAAEQAVARVRGLVADFQANGNSRELGDPTANVWHDAALQILRALDGDTRE